MEFLENFLKWFLENPWFLLLSFALSVVGTYLALISIKVKRLSYSVRSFRIVNPNEIDLPNLKITYDHQDIKQLTLTGIAIWNSGNETIRYQSDVDVIKICFNDGEKILNIDVLDKPTSELKCLKNCETEVLIEFNFLKPNQGATIQIVHTGNLHHSLKFDIQLINGEFRKISYSKSREDTPIYQTALSSAIIATFVNIALVFSLYYKIPGLAKVWYSVLAFIALSTMLYNFTLVWVAELFLYKLIARIPKKFKKFHNQATKN
jgi:hypothetical protein